MSSDTSGRSETLVEVYRRLRLYKAHSDSDFPDGNISSKESTGDFVSQRAGQRPPQFSNRAAVLVCLFEGEMGDIRVILTKRSPTMSSYSGEVAFPGGKWEEGDANDAETALREAKEEIGMDPSAVEVVTILEPFYGKGNTAVYPVVGIMWRKNGFNPVPNVIEVESVFDCPLEMFLQNGNRREEKHVHMGRDIVVHFFNYETENETYIIFALTAALLIKVASIAYQRPPAFDGFGSKFWGTRHGKL